MGLVEEWRSMDSKPVFLGLAAKTLEINLEPIADANSGELIACEALVRECKALGFAHPHALFNHAFEIDALKELELILARKAIAEIASLDAPRPRLFLNVDGRTLADWRSFRDVLVFELDTAGVSPAELCLEISEAQSVLDGDALTEAVQELRNTGFRIAIDDFGTGVSGLHMLYHARPNFLKIDRFFIRAMPADPHKRLLVRAVSRLAHTLGARVVAEGVETEEELLACRQADCDLIQGYLIKAPTEPYAYVQSQYALPGSDSVAVDIDHRLKKALQKPATVRPDVSLKELFEIFQAGQIASVVPVLDSSGTLLGGIVWDRLKPFLTSKYGEALSQNPSFDLNVADLIEQVPSFEADQPLANAIDLVADQARNGVIVVDRGIYKGYLSAYDLMKLANVVLLSEAHRRNPLSGLPGNEAINEFVNDMATRPDRSQCVFQIDISHFKAFNDRFGFEVGDRAILLLSDHLKRVGDITGCFVGHIGGDDFVVAHETEDFAAVTSLLERLPADFGASALALITPALRDMRQQSGQQQTVHKTSIPKFGATVVGQIFLPGQCMGEATDLATRLSDLKAEAHANEIEYFVPKA